MNVDPEVTVTVTVTGGKRDKKDPELSSIGAQRVSLSLYRPFRLLRRDRGETPLHPSTLAPFGLREVKAYIVPDSSPGNRNRVTQVMRKERKRAVIG